MRADYRSSRRVLVALGVGVFGALGVLAALAGAAPPVDTTINSAPAASTSSTSATFTFSASRTPATFTCKLDTGSSAACTSPKSYTGLAPGLHTFSVFATWSGNVDPSPATYTWRIDTTAPSVPTGLAATTPSTTSVKLTWNASSDNVGVTGYDVFRDSASLTTVGAVTTYTDSTVTAGSTHTYQVRARDAAANVSALTAAVSATTPVPPDTFIDTAPPVGTNSTSATFTFHASATPATFTCKLDTGAAAACTSPKTYTGLTQQVHTFTVFATVAGIADPTPATRSWTVDTIAPSAPTGLAAATPSSTSVALNWTAATDNTGVTGYDIFRDGALLTTIAPATAYTDSTVLAASTHTYAVRARHRGQRLCAERDRLGDDTDSVRRAPDSRAVSHRPGGPERDRELRDRPVGLGRERQVRARRRQRRVLAHDDAERDASHGGGERGLRVPVEGQPDAARGGQVLLPRSLGALDLLGANPSPTFTTQVPLGSTETFSFAVFGDWGQTNANGTNADQANVMRQIAASGALLRSPPETRPTRREARATSATSSRAVPTPARSSVGRSGAVSASRWPSSRPSATTGSREPT